MGEMADYYLESEDWDGEPYWGGSSVGHGKCNGDCGNCPERDDGFCEGEGLGISPPLRERKDGRRPNGRRG